jgi:hypothetical protein
MCGPNLHVRPGEPAYIPECPIVGIHEYSVRLPILWLMVLICALTRVRIRAEKTLKAIVIEVLYPTTQTAHA